MDKLADLAQSKVQAYLNKDDDDKPSQHQSSSQGYGTRCPSFPFPYLSLPRHPGVPVPAGPPPLLPRAPHPARKLVTDDSVCITTQQANLFLEATVSF